jgi:hypothetical protein
VTSLQVQEINDFFSMTLSGDDAFTTAFLLLLDQFGSVRGSCWDVKHLQGSWTCVLVTYSALILPLLRTVQVFVVFVLWLSTRCAG